MTKNQPISDQFIIDAIDKIEVDNCKSLIEDIRSDFETYTVKGKIMKAPAPDSESQYMILANLICDTLFVKHDPNIGFPKAIKFIEDYMPEFHDTNITAKDIIAYYVGKRIRKSRLTANKTKNMKQFIGNKECAETLKDSILEPTVLKPYMTANLTLGYMIVKDLNHIEILDAVKNMERSYLEYLRLHGYPRNDRERLDHSECFRDGAFWMLRYLHDTGVLTH